jgi:hypothetical protein
MQFSYYFFAFTLFAAMSHSAEFFNILILVTKLVIRISLLLRHVIKSVKSNYFSHSGPVIFFNIYS